MYGNSNCITACYIKQKNKQYLSLTDTMFLQSHARLTKIQREENPFLLPPELPYPPTRTAVYLSCSNKALGAWQGGAGTGLLAIPQQQKIISHFKDSTQMLFFRYRISMWLILTPPSRLSSAASFSVSSSMTHIF